MASEEESGILPARVRKEEVEEASTPEWVEKNVLALLYV